MFLLDRGSGIVGSESKRKSPHQMILQSALHEYLQLLKQKNCLRHKKISFSDKTKILLSWQLELQLECLLVALWSNLKPEQSKKGQKVPTHPPSTHPSCTPTLPFPMVCSKPLRSGHYENLPYYSIVGVGRSAFVLIALMCPPLVLNMALSYWNMRIMSLSSESM